MAAQEARGGCAQESSIVSKHGYMVTDLQDVKDYNMYDNG
jgi:hypothetical protein